MTGISEPISSETRAVYKNIRKNYIHQRGGRSDDKEDLIELKKTIFDKFYDRFAASFIALENKKSAEARAEQKRILEEQEADKKKKKTAEEIIEEKLMQM